MLAIRHPGTPLALFLCLALTACDGDTRQRRADRGADYVSDPDHLYFMNTRSRDYRQVTLAEGTDAYHHDEQTGEARFVIVDLWLEDRALLLRNDETLSVADARTTLAALRGQDRTAATEVVEDYLRLVTP